MQLYNITYLAFAAMAMSVEGRGAAGGGGGRAGRIAKGAGSHAGDVVTGATTIAGIIPKKIHYQHNCCRNNGPAGGGWIFDAWATALTKTACGKFSGATLDSNGVCIEAAGSPISGDSFYTACKNTVPGDPNVGAGYRGTC